MLRLFGHLVKFKSTNVANEVVIDPTNKYGIARIFSNRLYCWSTLYLVRKLVYIVNCSVMSQVVSNIHRAPPDCLFRSVRVIETQTELPNRFASALLKRLKSYKSWIES